MSEEKADARQALIFQVSTPVFWLCWWTVLVLHSVTLVFVTCAAAVHFMLSLPEVHSSTPALRISLTLKRITAASYLVVMLLHITALIQLVVLSIRNRQLVLRRPDTRHSPSRVPAVQAFRRLWDAVFGPTGVFGIQSQFFHTTFLLRELTEILLQSYQLLSLSNTVSRFWITDFAVAAVCLNCWAIPSINAVDFKREAARRFAHIVVDMHLDFVCAVSVPVCIMIPHILEFDWIKREFPMSLLLDDLWLTNAIADGRQVFVTSYIDFFSSLVPQYGVFSSLRLIKRLVRRYEQPTQAVVAIQPVSCPEQPPVSAQTNGKPVQVSRKEKRAMRIVSTCLVLWGIAILSLHIRAKNMAGVQELSACRLYLRPWFGQGVPCSVIFVNCARRNISGTADQLSTVLSQLDRAVLTRLVVGHCPQLTVPPDLTEFHALSSATVYNSTLVSWPRDASITEATHPVFVSVYFHRCSLHGFPEGFLHTNLPRSFAILSISSSQLVNSTIPEDIGDLWANSGLEALLLDDLKLRTLPKSIGKLPIRELLLADNLLEELDPETFQDLHLYKLDVSGNALLRTLKTIGDISRLQILLVEHTNVSVLPAWAVDWATSKPGHLDLRVGSFYGSPACEQNQDASQYPLQLCSQERHVHDLYRVVRDQYAV